MKNLMLITGAVVALLVSAGSAAAAPPSDAQLARADLTGQALSWDYGFVPQVGQVTRQVDLCPGGQFRLEDVWATGRHKFFGSWRVASASWTSYPRTALIRWSVPLEHGTSSGSIEIALPTKASVFVGSIPATLATSSEC
jgi:hypothetical protein